MYNFPIDNIRQSLGNLSIISGASEVLLNDNNLKPDWIEHHAKYSEIFIKRGRDTLLINIGESWTYGETLPNIATAIQKYDLISQLTNSFGPRLATTLDSDFYQYAVPGNCNFYMFQELQRILEYVKDLGYKKIYIAIQMTEPGREDAIRIKLGSHPLSKIYSRSDDLIPMTFVDWLTAYDEIFFELYNNIIKNSGLPIDAVLWKNFCSVNTPKRDYNFKIVDTSWIRYSGKIVGKDIEMPQFYSMGWLDTMQLFYKKSIQFDFEFLNNELDKIEKCNAFIKYNPLHNNHPNVYGHLLWSQYLARQSGWVNDI